MKRSNILIISAILIATSWLLVSGWLQANLYNISKTGKSTRYAEIMGIGNVKKIHSFKNIKVDFVNYSWCPRIAIQYDKKQNISFSNGLDKAISYSVSRDTLYLKINYDVYNNDDYININVPLLKSVNMSSSTDISNGGHSNYKNNTTISGFNANTLSINFNCPYQLKLQNNKLNKLDLKGYFYKNGKVEIANYSDYDSLNVNIEGNNGTLIMSQDSRIRENPKQWFNIKVPASVRIEADAIIASKIIIKK